MWQNSNFDQHSNCDLTQNWNCDKSKKKIDNSKTQVWQNIHYDQSQFMTKDTLEWSFSKNVLTPRHPMRFSLGSFLWFSQCFHIWLFKLSKSTIRIFCNFCHHKWDPFDLGGVKISQFRFASSLRWNKTTSDILE